MTDDSFSLECASCALCLRLVPRSPADLVASLRAFFVAHPNCATSIGLPGCADAAAGRRAG